MKHSIAALFLLLVTCPLLTSGCEPCEQLCVAEADAYALCLGDWDMIWEDVGYAGTEEYEALCKDEAELDRGRLTTSEKLNEDKDCNALKKVLNSTDDCEELYDALEGISPE